MEESCENKSAPKTFKEFLKSSGFWKPAAGLILGGIAGFLYYHYVGCASGTCAITSNPISSVIFGSAIGFFLVNSPCRSC
ncbi:MAG: hypothetical protein WCO63_10410 [Bacteroidota bacterium]